MNRITYENMHEHGWKADPERGGVWLHESGASVRRVQDWYGHPAFQCWRASGIAWGGVMGEPVEAMRNLNREWMGLSPEGR